MSKCNHDPETLTCKACGHVASRLPHFRQCKPPPQPYKRKPREPQPEDFIAESRGLGDITADWLAARGITKDRVEKWLGRKCNCPERQEWLNKVGRLFGIGT